MSTVIQGRDESSHHITPNNSQLVNISLKLNTLSSDRWQNYNLKDYQIFKLHCSYLTNNPAELWYVCVTLTWVHYITMLLLLSFEGCNLVRSSGLNNSSFFRVESHCLFIIFRRTQRFRFNLLLPPPCIHCRPEPVARWLIREVILRWRGCLRMRT